VPIYEYRCPNGHEFEVVQRMTDDPVSTCEVCGEAVERVFRPVAVHFKGSGFYTTDYARKGRDDSKAGAKSDAKGSSDSAKSESKSSGDSGSGSSDKAKTSSGKD
jgi:putative FmdB family regulatory protein